MKKVSVFFSAVLFIFPAILFAQTSSKEVKLTTYYPAPYGEYENLTVAEQIVAGYGEYENLTVAEQIVGGFGAQSKGGTKDWNDTSNARSGSGYTLLEGNDANGPGPGPGRYFHPFSFEYSTKDGTGDMTQFAIPHYADYVDGGSSLFMRARSNNAWTSWRKILSEDKNGRVTIGTFDNPNDYTLNVNGSVNVKELYVDDQPLTAAGAVAGTLTCTTVSTGGKRVNCPTGYIVTGCGTWESDEDDQISGNGCYNNEKKVWARCCKIV